MRVLRTPDERFVDLPGYDFAPHYVEISGLRMHYVDEGRARRSAAPVTDGEPSWSFLYRKMVPPLSRAGLRVVAPDLVGCGRSDKPAERSDYTYQRHVDWMTAFVRALDLREVTEAHPRRCWTAAHDHRGRGHFLQEDRGEELAAVVAASWHARADRSPRAVPASVLSLSRRRQPLPRLPAVPV